MLRQMIGGLGGGEWGKQVKCKVQGLTHQDLQLWKPAFDFPVPNQDGFFSMEEEPYPETTCGLFRIERKNGDRFDHRRWEC